MSKNYKHNLYFIIDFAAKNEYTHHSYYVKLYAEFLKQKNLDYVILISKYADREKIYEETNHMLYCLVSNLYGPSITQQPFYYFYSKFLDLLAKNFKSFFTNNLKNLFAKPYLNILSREIFNVLRLKKVTLEDTALHFIFPTGDPLSILFMKNSQQLYPCARFYMRLVGGESRGSLASSEVYLEIQSCIMKKVNLRIGYEVRNYRDFLISAGVSPAVLFDATPPLRNRNKKESASKLTLGFLGTAKKRKGFELIPGIIKNLTANKISADIHIQGTFFPWETYPAIIEEIYQLRQESKNKLHIYEKSLDENEFSNLLQLCNVAILPYDESYINFGSATLFHCIEQNVYVITSKVAGFAENVLKYHLGGVYSEPSEITNLINSYQYSANNFNKYRLLSLEWTEEFLDLKV